MSWSINTRDLVRMHSFATAKKHWEGQKEWRNEHTSWRPLSNRRATHKRIIKLHDERGYECVLYNTALVTYFADGSIALKTHDTRSSVDFAYCVAPQGCNPLSHKGRMFWQVSTDDGVRFYAEGDNPLLLKPTERDNWHLTTQPTGHMQWVYDRKKGAEVQKMLRPYADWYRLTDRLDGLPRNYWPNVIHPRTNNVFEIQNMLATNSFMPLALAYGPPDWIRPVLYEAHGARYKAPVPHTSLPKEFA